ncbi:MAG: hypothetical protein DI537_05280 [Stutzerimonas stutzeri]|nr:MAG: hypothetical protein DI537_05280 [Stutzerimonas stutzeri]
MDDEGAVLGPADARGMFEKFSNLAKDGLSGASQGMREMLTGKEIGHPEAPESGSSRSMKLGTAIGIVAEKGLDPVTYQGFERSTHQIAQNEFEHHRSGRDRGRSVGGRDFE